MLPVLALTGTIMMCPSCTDGNDQLRLPLSPGMDLVLTRHKDAIVPVVIEVNAHDCLYHVTVLETMQARQRGVAVRTLVHTMLARSQRFLVAGRVVVVVGAGGFSKRHVWTAARQLGVKVSPPLSHYPPAGSQGKSTLVSLPASWESR